MDLLIENRAYIVNISPDMQSFIVDYKVIKGDKGDPGINADMSAHTNAFNHSLLHSHPNKDVLDNIVWDAYNGLLCYGQGLVDILPYFINTVPRTVYSGTDAGTGSVWTDTRLEFYLGKITLCHYRTYNAPEQGGGG